MTAVAWMDAGIGAAYQWVTEPLTDFRTGRSEVETPDRPSAAFGAGRKFRPRTQLTLLGGAVR